MSLIYLISKFAHEALVIELFLISILGLSLFGFFLFKRRKYGAAKNNISDQVVRAFLTEILSISESFRMQLFGETLKVNAADKGASQFAATSEAAKALAETMMASGGADVVALKSQLTAALAKQEELTKTVSQLNNEKSKLEEKAKNAVAAAAAAATAGAGAAAASSGNSAELQKALDEARAKLAEYEIIEDDLANLKRYQQENKQLRAEIEALRGGAAPEAASAEQAQAAAESEPALEPAAAEEEAPEMEAASPIEEAESKVQEEIPDASLEELATKVDESLSATPPAGASASDPAATEAAQTTAASTDAAPESKEKPAAAAESNTDSDLLSEFEKMLSS